MAVVPSSVLLSAAAGMSTKLLLGCVCMLCRGLLAEAAGKCLAIFYNEGSKGSEGGPKHDVLSSILGQVRTHSASSQLMPCNTSVLTIVCICGAPTG
jgi:hypothetical protein